MSLTNWDGLHGNGFDQMPVLVTGGAGFIGSHLCEALVNLGARVCLIDDLSGGVEANLEPARDQASDPRQIRLIRGSILDRDLLGEASRGAYVIFHHAALGSVPESVADPQRYQQVNSRGTLNVLEAARAADVRRVVFAASSAAYGSGPTLPKVETLPPTPASPYAATKVAGEALMAAWAASYSLDTVSLRYFNIFGPRQNANSAYAAVIAAFAAAYTQGRFPRIFGDGEQTRDFTHVDNVVHANLLAARAASPLDGELINIASGRTVTVNELAGQLAERFARADLEPDYQPPRAGDVRHSSADLAKATDLLGYRPVVDFDAGLAETAAWYAKMNPL